MQHTKTRSFALATGFLAAALATVSLAPQAVSQSGPGWVTLIDGKSMGDWDRFRETNWRLEDGAVVADDNKGKAAYLVSKESYKPDHLPRKPMPWRKIERWRLKYQKTAE